MKLKRKYMYNKCTKCRKELVYDLVKTDLYEAECCGEKYFIENIMIYG